MPEPKPGRRVSARCRTPARNRNGRAALEKKVATTAADAQVQPSSEDARAKISDSGTHLIWPFLCKIFRLTFVGCILVVLILPIQPLRFIVCSLSNKYRHIQLGSVSYIHGFCTVGHSNADHIIGTITFITVFQGIAIWLSILSSQLGDRDADFTATRKKVAETIRVTTVSMVFAFMVWEFSFGDTGATFIWANALRNTVYIPLVYT